ncbi:MAG: MFS transporter [Clostridia bacterium]|nr:MFS transporter [Clostridia bacterium]
MKGFFNWLNKTRIFRDLSPQEFSWVLYDVGNSAYTMLACSLIPIWFKALAVKEVAEGVAAKGYLTEVDATGAYSLVLSIVTIIIALLGPMLGAFADRKDTKKIFFTTTVAIGVVGCLLNSVAWSWILFLILYVITKVSYQASLTFYDSMLNDVTTEERMDRVSSYGYAWGYIGSCIPFLVALVAYVLSGGMFDVLPPLVGKIIGFGITAVWWLLVTIPLIKNYKQNNYVEVQHTTVGKVFKKIFSTFKTIVLEDKKVLFFLIAFFLYIDGVGTIIDNCINIGTPMISEDPSLAKYVDVFLVGFLLATQVVAFVGSLVFAAMSKKFKTVPLILVCIVGYFAVCLYALRLDKLYQFAILAFGVGCFQGSIQSLSRSYYSKIIPPENSGEYFGIYDIFSKGASFLGSFVIWLVLSIVPGGISIGSFRIRPYNLAVAMLAIFFALGFVFLIISSKQKNRRGLPEDV